MTDNAWILSMYGVSVVGALAGMFYPMLIGTWRAGPGLLGQRVNFIVAGIVIALIVSALGFFAYLNPALRDGLKDLGLLAFFSAFTYGFGAGCAIEEPLKKP